MLLSSSILVVDCLGCLLQRDLPLLNLLEASLACIEHPPGGADEQSQDPSVPRAGEVSSLVVSRRLRDPADRVANRASCPLNGQKAEHLRTH